MNFLQVDKTLTKDTVRSKNKIGTKNIIRIKRDKTKINNCLLHLATRGRQMRSCLILFGEF